MSFLRQSTSIVIPFTVNMVNDWCSVWFYRIKSKKRKKKRKKNGQNEKKIFYIGTQMSHECEDFQIQKWWHNQLQFKDNKHQLHPNADTTNYIPMMTSPMTSQMMTPPTTFQWRHQDDDITNYTPMMTQATSPQMMTTPNTSQWWHHQLSLIDDNTNYTFKDAQPTTP